MNTLNPSIKHHTFVGIFIALWIFIFTYYIRPFDGKNFSFFWWEFLGIGFAIIAFMSYFIVSMIQDSIYKKIDLWNIYLEILSILIFHLLNFFLSYMYYKSPFLNGIWNLNEYASGILKSAIIFTPVIIFGRSLTLRFSPQIETKNLEKSDNENIDVDIIIKGEYKLDILKIKKSELVCVSKSQNYVEVYFTENNHLNSKLIRSSLKKIHDEFSFLVQVHRSHLINPTHFKSWKNNNTLSLTQIEIPVSKTYKENIGLL
ncbi:histidine kinase [Tenacibaculum sp. SZ-18]|uniref:LytTR family DNA-binding domain-containing protein n=1 Tax=Tenacibaculum sp. SZ-18 TaxID=754423 RepID=UPI000C2D0092|nr:LytTR family DNA-binding domain-containing protein [Tenacibaculum sp. SZ-18]AUC15623.1 histidine kinase [Tenacibaculum sp. SZ-18]